jgi:flagellar biosynthesis chaperone FliJ
MARKFKFQLQPALDKAVSEQEKAEQAVLAARRELEAAEAKLCQLEAVVEATRQRIRDEHASLIKPNKDPASALTFMERDECIKALKVRQVKEQKAVDAQKMEVAFCRQKLELRRDELNHAIMQVKAMEKLRDKAMEEFKKEGERLLQNEIDESGMQRSARRDG